MPPVPTVAVGPWHAGSEHAPQRPSHDHPRPVRQAPCSLQSSAASRTAVFVCACWRGSQSTLGLWKGRHVVHVSVVNTPSLPGTVVQHATFVDLGCPKATHKAETQQHWQRSQAVAVERVLSTSNGCSVYPGWYSVQGIQQRYSFCVAHSTLVSANPPQDCQRIVASSKSNLGDGWGVWQ